MGKTEEIINGLSTGILKGPYKESELTEYKRYFEFASVFLAPGQRLWMTASERPSETIDFELSFILGQLTSDCGIELLKLNFSGIYAGPFFISIIDSEDPPAYLLCLKYNLTVPTSTSSKEAIDIFTGDFMGLLARKANWPEGVLIWTKDA